MQKRFCVCGHVVLVRYQCNKGAWVPRIVTFDRVRRRSGGRQTCPSCGCPLDIHALR